MKSIVIISSIALLCTLLSCKKETSPNKPIDVKRDSINSFYKDSVYTDFEFPDTVFRNQFYKGKIKYKCILDTITTSFDDSINQRYILFFMAKTKAIYSIKDIRKFKLDTFGALDAHTIPIKIKFLNNGTYYLDGIINDHVLIDTIKDHKRSRNKVRYIEKESRATHKVVVIDDNEE